ncbi:hypothetical protein C0583_03445 [Candidatus Parcubacteria bacterium]|nr:MAG: hypothetical protein C0583_03445 [Candidatus Parcubacteria bacterium]
MFISLQNKNINYFLNYYIIPIAISGLLFAIAYLIYRDNKSYKYFYLLAIIIFPLKFLIAQLLFSKRIFWEGVMTRLIDTSSLFFLFLNIILFSFIYNYYKKNDSHVPKTTETNTTTEQIEEMKTSTIPNTNEIKIAKLLGISLIFSVLSIIIIFLIAKNMTCPGCWINPAPVITAYFGGPLIILILSLIGGITIFKEKKITSISILFIFSFIFYFVLGSMIINYQKILPASIVCNFADDERSKNFCLMDKAKQTNNKNICNKIKNDQSQSVCLLNFMRKTSDPKLCEEMKDSYKKSDCYFYYAGKQKNTDLCLKVTGSGSLANCYTSIAKQGDPTVCGLSPIPSTCFREYYLNFNERKIPSIDKSQCDGIQDTTAKNTCISYLNQYIEKKESGIVWMIDNKLEGKMTENNKKEVQKFYFLTSSVFEDMLNNLVDNKKITIIDNTYYTVKEGAPIIRKDSDNDGLSDEDELKYKTDINNPDTDNDSYSDGDEVKNGFDPLN